MAPLARDADLTGELPTAAVTALAEADLFRVTIGEKWGGLGLGDVEAAIVLEEIARHDVSVGHLLPTGLQRTLPAASSTSVATR